MPQGKVADQPLSWLRIRGHTEGIIAVGALIKGQSTVAQCHSTRITLSAMPERTRKFNKVKKCGHMQAFMSYLMLEPQLIVAAFYRGDVDCGTHRKLVRVYV